MVWGVSERNATPQAADGLEPLLEMNFYSVYFEEKLYRVVHLSHSSSPLPVKVEAKW